MPELPAAGNNGGRVRGFGDLVDRVVESFPVRLGLSVAIIASLLPEGWVDGMEPFFLGVFATEFLARIAVLVAGRPSDDLIDPVRVRRSRASQWALLIVDLLALLSFLPVPRTVEGARWLRLLRLSRMVLLVGYWSPLVLDLWSILARRERARQVVLMGFVVAVLSFAGAVVLHHLGASGIDINGDGGVDDGDKNFWALLWWAFRQVQDPGNMLASTVAVEAVVVSLGLTIFGLFLVSFLIGLGTDVVHELLEISRLRPPGFQGHTVLVNVGPGGQRLLAELLRYYQKLRPADARMFSRDWWAKLLANRTGLLGPQYVVAGAGEEPPEFLRRPGFARIVYRQRPAEEADFIERVDALSARRVLLLADHRDATPDTRTIESLFSLVETYRAFDGGRDRLILAEILDDGNVAAARSAVEASGVRGFVVPTEKLAGLYLSAVARRPGLGDVLDELLSSYGHELYTCFFDMPGLSFSRGAPRFAGRGPVAVMDELVSRGLTRAGSRVIPIGVITDAAQEHLDFAVSVNPRQGVEDRQPRVRGFAAVADNFGGIRDFARELDDPPRRPPAAAAHALEFESVATPPLQRIVVCGFRPGTVYLLDDLLRASPGARATIFVDDEAAKQRACEALSAHKALVSAGVRSSGGGSFLPQSAGFTFEGKDGAAAAHVDVVVADWVATRVLLDLPGGAGHVRQQDLLVFVADPLGEADARITTALLKLEDLCRGADDDGPRILAEVSDARLALRLTTRFRERDALRLRVISLEELRALFLFQAVVVPGFDVVYSELLGAWGSSLVRRTPKLSPTSPGTVSFEALSGAARARGEILVAVVMEGSDGRERVVIAPDRDQAGDLLDKSELLAIWVVKPEDSP